MKIYAFSGLGADQRIFSYLKLDHEIIPIQWIVPEPNETLESYAGRLGEQIDTSESFALLGVSFGGMLASELSKTLKPVATILISSAATRHELPWMANVSQRYRLAQKIPTRLFKPPVLGAYVGFPFHKRNREVAKGIIRDTDPQFVQWALGAIVNWKNETHPENLYHIHGRLDPILPYKKRMGAEALGTGHFIILKEAEEISLRINQFLIPNSQSLSPNP